jgi:DNA-binding FrmR family transcriptional regulator
MKGVKKALAVEPTAKERNVARLRRIEGQVRGLQKMIEEERWCPDIVAQIRSVEAALRGVESELVKGHLRHCAAHALAAGSEQEQEAMIAELAELLARR